MSGNSPKHSPAQDLLRGPGVTSPTPSIRHISARRVNAVDRSGASGGGPAAPVAGIAHAATAPALLGSVPTNGAPASSVLADGPAPSSRAPSVDAVSMSEIPSVSIEPLHSRNLLSYGTANDNESIVYKMSNGAGAGSGAGAHGHGRPNSGFSNNNNANYQRNPERLALLSPHPSHPPPPNGGGQGGGGHVFSSSTGLEYVPTTSSNVDVADYKFFVPYYLPCLSWIPHYCAEFFVGDLIGGLSLVFFQLPLSLSYASSLAHVPIISGLYSLAISPLIYMIFGSVPQMIVGPEGAISLIVGQAVEPLLHHASKKHPVNPMEIVVAITFISGASLLGFGLGRFGFLDNVLSASLLKGFISGVGIVMIVNAFIVMLGLSKLMEDVANDPAMPDIHSPFDKFRFLVEYFRELHPLTFEVSMAGLLVIMALRIYKKQAARRKLRYRQYVVYIPEILIVVIISTWVVAYWQLDHQGIKIIGKVANSPFAGEGGGHQKIFYNPLSPRLWPIAKQVTTSGFLCAMLGFFESTTASKSLGSTYDLPISSNRELVALGFINVVGSVFGALPAFGGYGRSKINAMSARTTMSGAIMGLCTIFTIVFLMDYLYYIPKCTLSVVTCVIGISLIEEAPGEIWFHWRSHGYNELITFGVTVTTTLFFSMESGIAVGLIYSLIRVIKHSAASRIQILGRIPGTNTFLNADEPAPVHGDGGSGSGAGAGSGGGAGAPHAPVNHLHPTIIHSDHSVVHPPESADATVPVHNPMAAAQGLHRAASASHLSYLNDDHLTYLNYQALEEIEGCLIIKIPEPLTFTNTSDLKSRLKRVEMYGSTRAHPAMKRVRDASMTKYIIFDLNGMTELDSSAAQILKEILTNYEDRKIYSFFVRVTKSAKLRDRFYNCGIKDLLIKDLCDLNYFAHQPSDASRGAAGAATATGLSKDASVSSSVSSLANLTESLDSPYFDHISDALKVIDHFENSAVEEQV